MYHTVLMDENLILRIRKFMQVQPKFTFRP